MIIGLIEASIGLGLLIVLVAGLLAPLESMGWWAGWTGPDDMKAGAPTRLLESLAPAAQQPDARVIILYGINDSSDTLRLAHEEDYAAALARALPGCNIIADLFPYSAFGMPLNGDRALAGFWQKVAHPNGRLAALFTFTINLRNFLQVLTSADRRYGPFYNFGLAQVIVDALLRDGHDPARPRPLVLVGYSGGGQLAIAAADYVHRALDVPVHVVALGGFMSAAPGLDGVSMLTHVRGSRDWLQAMAALVFPQRWPGIPLSPWNRALAEGRISDVVLEGVMHSGPEGYFGSVLLAGTHTPMQLSVAAAADATRSAVRTAAAAPPRPAGGTRPEAR